MMKRIAVSPSDLWKLASQLRSYADKTGDDTKVSDANFSDDDPGSIQLVNDIDVKTLDGDGFKVIFDECCNALSRKTFRL